jgi:hypothetical protein
MIIVRRVINTSRLLSNVLVSDILLNLETEKICNAEMPKEESSMCTKALLKKW